MDIAIYNFYQYHLMYELYDVHMLLYTTGGIFYLYLVCGSRIYILQIHSNNFNNYSSYYKLSDIVSNSIIIQTMSNRYPI